MASSWLWLARASARSRHPAKGPALGLGVGERVGNTPMDLLLVNLALLGWSDRRLDGLGESCRFVADTTGVPFPDNDPVLGRDAFRTMAAGDEDESEEEE